MWSVWNCSVYSFLLSFSLLAVSTLICFIVYLFIIKPQFSNRQFGSQIIGERHNYV
nr:p6 [Allamanda chlorotic virus A]